MLVMACEYTQLSYLDADIIISRRSSTVMSPGDRCDVASVESFADKGWSAIRDRRRHIVNRLIIVLLMVFSQGS